MTKTSVQVRESFTAAEATCDPLSESQTAFCSLFRTIPPERVGLNGEYDHSGLAKRVLQALKTRFAAKDLQGLRVMQRGKVVILLGSVASMELLKQCVSIAQRIEGAIDVEINGIRLK